MGGTRLVIGCLVLVMHLTCIWRSSFRVAFRNHTLMSAESFCQHLLNQNKPVFLLDTCETKTLVDSGAKPVSANQFDLIKADLR